ncbi:hypothetical protein F2Q69_00001539 [Brassica cretica]|uniref:Uncharacterized protein n=1 Tax=Brassica cretica TaxID=69181 RepID=A0A8S9NVZ2_BRACR|nr:hypothetical protein F2Q69_00001539 [Brassica cretica]
MEKKGTQGRRVYGGEAFSTAGEITMMPIYRLQENDLGPWANSCKAKAASQRSIWIEGQMNCESGVVRLQENDLGPWANSCKAKAASQRSIWTEGQMNCESGAVKVWCTSQEESVLKIDMKANIWCVKYNLGSSNFIALDTITHLQI